MARLIPARSPYNKRPPPPTYDAGFFAVELALVQRAIPPISIRTVIADSLVTAADETVLGDTTASDFAVALPDAARSYNLLVTIKNIGTGTLTVTGTVDGAVNPTLAQNKSMTVQSDGIAYYKIGAV